MSYMNQSGARSDGPFVGVHNCVDILDRKVEAYLLVYDAIAFRSLPVRIHHVGIVLLRPDDLVSRFERKSVDDRIQGFGRVAVDRNLFSRSTRQLSQLLP